MNYTLLKNSLLVSALTTLLALAFGFIVALFLAGLDRRWRLWWIGGAVVGLALPPFLVAGCWLHLLGLAGVWRAWLPFDIYSLGGTSWVLSLMLWPISLVRSEEHTSELQSLAYLVCRLLLEKKKKIN